MTMREVIESIEKQAFNIALENERKANMMNTNGWIPVSERLPVTEEEDGCCHVMVSMDDEFVCTTDYIDGEGFELWEDSGEVIAWMPLPEPYKI